jgi:hypothetical protein
MPNDRTELAEAVVPAKKRRGRGPAKTFPLSSFEDTLVLAGAIHDHGVDGVLRRTTVFDRLGRSAESGPSRRLVTASARYGLTLGSYQAEQLRLTENGAKLLSPETPPRERKEIEFDLAIRQIDPFNAVYERLKDKRVPAQDVLVDQLTDVGPSDRQRCAAVFLENVRYLGLMKDVAGGERIITLEQSLEEASAGAPRGEATTGQQRVEEQGGPAGEQLPPAPAPSEPEVHIDINIRIDSSVSAEQIDQLFASMARHLYRREEKR